MSTLILTINEIHINLSEHHNLVNVTLSVCLVVLFTSIFLFAFHLLCWFLCFLIVRYLFRINGCASCRSTTLVKPYTNYFFNTNTTPSHGQFLPYLLVSSLNCAAHSLFWKLWSYFLLFLENFEAKLEINK